MTTHEWIDVSVLLRTGMVHWPDNPPVSIERTLDIESGDVVNVSKLSMGAHTGTYMDAPLHFFQKGKGIPTMPLSVGMGQAHVIEIRAPGAIEANSYSAATPPGHDCAESRSWCFYLTGLLRCSGISTRTGNHSWGICSRCDHEIS